MYLANFGVGWTTTHCDVSWSKSLIGHGNPFRSALPSIVKELVPEKFKQKATWLETNRFIIFYLHHCRVLKKIIHDPSRGCHNITFYYYHHIVVSQDSQLPMLCTKCPPSVQLLLVFCGKGGEFISVKKSTLFFIGRLFYVQVRRQTTRTTRTSVSPPLSPNLFTEGKTSFTRLKNDALASITHGVIDQNSLSLARY